MVANLESSSSYADSDVLMIDPFLDYINEILMEEGMDDATSMQYVNDASYQAIFNDFYYILGKHSSPHSSSESSSYESVFDPHVQHQSVYSSHDNAIKLDVGVCMDAVVDRRSGHIGLEEGNGKLRPLKGHYIGQEEGNGTLNLPSADEQFSSKLADVDLMSFEDLKLNEVYTDLYVGEPSSSSTRAAKDSKPNREKKKSNFSAGKGSTSVGEKEILVMCAQAVAIGDARRANEILQELCQVHGASANGTGIQRTAHFFSKALAARMRGMGEREFKAMSHNMPPAMTLIKASKLGFEESPFVKVMHYFANQSILTAAEGASRLHIVDYGSMYGIQWPCLINALGDRKGGPPLLVITIIEFPKPGTKTAERLDETGRRLASYAKTHNVPFQYHAVVTNKWEAASLHLHEGEVLVINCIKRLRHLADESADLASTISPRQKLLAYMHSLNPHLLITAVVSAAYNSTFFVSRFREALYYFSNLFDMLDTLWGDTPQRRIVERSCLYRDILNIVACEGAERVERPETHKQWHARITKAGFEVLPIPPTILSRTKSHVKQHHHKEFLIDDDASGWMLIGWKGRTTVAISAWKPKVLKGNAP